MSPRCTTFARSGRLSDSILLAFYHACDQGALDLAAELLRCCEVAMQAGGTTTVDRRRNDEALIEAFEHLWFLRRPEPPALHAHVAIG